MKKKIKCAAELNECTAEPYCALEPPPDLPEGGSTQKGRFLLCTFL